MHCHECGERLSGDAKFCSSCGAKVRIVAPVVEAATAVGTDVVVAETKAGTATRYAKVAAGEVVEAGRSAMKTKLGKEVAAGAAVGAVLAVPIPLVGPIAGAAIGAGIVLYKRYWKG